MLPLPPKPKQLHPLPHLIILALKLLTLQGQNKYGKSLIA
jgi:hypothetical protein